jgi:hypothetical protein
VVNNSKNSIQFFIHVRAELNSQWPVRESAQIQTTVLRQNRTKQTKKQQNKKILTMITKVTIVMTFQFLGGEQIILHMVHVLLV